MFCNSKNIVCMIFRPKCRSKAVAYQFPNFTVNKEQLSLNTINNSPLADADIFIENGEIYSIAAMCWQGVLARDSIIALCSLR